MNVIDYITITCNLKNVRLQITSNYMKKCNRLQLLQLQITITPCLTSDCGCSNIYNIFIKYIVLYDEIHLKYCRDTVAYG